MKFIKQWFWNTIDPILMIICVIADFLVYGGLFLLKGHRESPQYYLVQYGIGLVLAALLLTRREQKESE